MTVAILRTTKNPPSDFTIHGKSDLTTKDGGLVRLDKQLDAQRQLERFYPLNNSDELHLRPLCWRQWLDITLCDDCNY
ncbi:hypothetical protein BLA27_09555 [Brucella cytisi]|uniref:Uncharacterized protein n=1 Tax=Brucella cytisi TaxID=407152 RepID=A0A1J6I7W6_9HYPH|nr:hypothetical protein BLA27_09555 [Brucella cytisi]